MYKKLEKLCELNSQMDLLLSEAEICKEELKKEHKVIETLKVEEFLKTLKQLASYGKKITYSYRPNGAMIHTDIPLAYYSASNTPVLLFEVDEDGEFKIKTNPSGYSYYPVIYDSRENKWGWYQKESRTFFALNGNIIVNEIKKELESLLRRNMRQKARNAMEQKDQMISLFNVIAM